MNLDAMYSSCSNVTNDFRLAVRLALRSGRLTVVSILLLGIGIGAVTLFFSIVDALLLRPLPVTDPYTLVRMVQRFPTIGSMNSLPSAYYEDLAKHAGALSAVFGEAHIQVNLTRVGPSEVVQVFLPTPRYFEELFPHVLYGRALEARDENFSETPPVVLSYAFWHRKFGGDPAILGRSLFLNGHPFVVVGILPPEFNGLSVDTGPDIRAPFGALASLWNPASGRPIQYVEFELAGRLKPGVTREQAQSECLSIWRNNVDAYFPNQPEQARFAKQVGMALDPLSHGTSVISNRYESTLKLLLASAGVLWLTVCLTVGGLMLARATMRRSEFAVRKALGATSMHFVRLVLVENLMTTTFGLLGGLVIAYSLPSVLVGLLPTLRDFSGRRIDLAIDLCLHSRVLLFSCLTTAITVLLVGLAPCVSALGVNVTSVLRESRSGGRLWGRHFLVACQVGLCTTALVVTGLLVRTIINLSTVDPGFDQNHVVTFSLNPSLSGYSRNETNAFIHGAAERVSAIPGVDAVGLSMVGVMRGRGISLTIARAGSNAGLKVNVNYVSPEYFRSMGMSTLAGSKVLANENLDTSPRKAVVNRSFARHFFGDNSPLGEAVGSSEQTEVAKAEYVISAVVADAKYRSIREPVVPTIYILTREYSSANVTVRSKLEAVKMISEIRQAIAGLDPTMPIVEISKLNADVSTSMAGERIAAGVAVGFGGMAALLTGIGIFGLVTYALQQRRAEFGVRMALGAHPKAIVSLVARQACWSVLPGIVCGCTVAAALSPLTSTLVYEVPPVDWLTFSATVLLVIVIATASMFGPLRGIVRTQPSEALKHWE